MPVTLRALKKRCQAWRRSERYSIIYSVEWNERLLLLPLGQHSHRVNAQLFLNLRHLGRHAPVMPCLSNTDSVYWNDPKLPDLRGNPLRSPSSGAQNKGGERISLAALHTACQPSRTSRDSRARRYSPTRMIGSVGLVEPPAASIVTPKAFASTPLGSGGRITLALPPVSGWNVPAGIGAWPFAGISHSS